MFLPNKIDHSWKAFLTEERKLEIKELENTIGEDYNPKDQAKVLRFLSINLHDAKVVWLGQDVYPAEGVATGRAFEVGTLKSWNEPFRQVSLKNIIRLIHKEYRGIVSYDDISSYSNIKAEILDKTFPILEPRDWFDDLEKQGVLFLNTSYTCKVGIPNSHKQLWSKFSEDVFEYISTINPNLTWFLWGREAQANKPFILKGNVLESRHPSRVHKASIDDFLKFTGFRETSNEINWLGKKF